jgi:hypothetical protein
MGQADEWLDHARLDELAQCGFGNADMAADAGEPDAPLRDEAAAGFGEEVAVMRNVA